MNQLAQRSQLSFTLKVLNGPDKGSVYRLLSQSVKIGRDEDNDISLKHDKKCSRHHAVIAMSPNGLEIKNTSGHNALIINGNEVQTAVLSPNSIIQIGDTKLQFNLNNEFDAAGNALASTKSPGLRKKRRAKHQKSGPSLFFYIILAGLIGLVYMLMTAETKKTEIPTIPTKEEVSAQIEKSRSLAESLRQERRASGRDTREFREAQSAYVKGFRDAQKGQYERAMGHFQTCIAIFPQHPLCGKAFTDAKSKFDSLVQYYFDLGRGYFTRNQFRQCKNAFRNVMIMQRDKSSDIYREAEAQFQACDLKERERL